MIVGSKSILNMIKNLVSSIVVIILFTACSNKLSEDDFREALINGNSGAIKMLLIDSNVYLKATTKKLDSVTWELLKSTIVKIDVIRQFEEEIGGKYKIENNLTIGKINQFCWANNFLLAHRNDFPPNIDHSKTYTWVETKQKVFKKMLDESLGDRRMEDDCRI
ncbi:hypothetical protein [Acinetobacter colistiniresistens]|nr:hypothetical protein [Acinetobacter colistiniresistens]